MSFLLHNLEKNTLRCYYSYSGVPNMSTTILNEILNFQKKFIEDNYEINGVVPKYLTVESKYPNKFCLGGDLFYFLDCIDNQKEDKLLEYAYTCVDCLVLFRQISQKIITISYFEGDCFGGGFESSLAGQYCFAFSEKVKVGFPEAMFGLFPGMGGHTVCNEVFNDMDKVEQFIKSAPIMTAKEAVKLGFLDGIGKLPESLPFKKKSLFDKDTLIKKTEQWVEQALRLDKVNIRKMKIIAKKQMSMGA